MCVAVYVPKGEKISKEIFDNCENANPDGCGFAYVKKDKIEVCRSLEGAKLWQHLKRINGKHNIVLHFRIATHGEVSLENCHPFRVSKSLILSHNGILNIKLKDKTRSDTYALASLLGSLPDGFLERGVYRWLLDEAVSPDKLLFMDGVGNVTIIGENRGSWVEGLWFSNTYWRAKKKSYVPSGYYGSIGGSECEQCGRVHYGVGDFCWTCSRQSYS